MPPIARLAASCILFAAASAQDTAPDELLDLALRSAAPARFAAWRPAFTVEDMPMSHLSPGGPVTSTWRVLRDHGLVIGFLSDKDRRWEMTTFIPGNGQADVPRTPRYHNSNMVDTRIILGYGQKPETWATPTLGVKIGADQVSLHYAALRADGGWRFTYDLRLRVDPVLGYVSEIDFLDDRAEVKPGARVEFINHFSRGLTDVWPGQSTFDRTVVCRADRPGLIGWWNNLAGVELSDNGPKALRTGGFMAWLDGPGLGDGQGRAMAWLAGEHAFDTCNCWADNHNQVIFPRQPDADGRWRATPRFRLSALPAEACALALREAAFDSFGDRPSIFLRVGVREDFLGQPFTPASRVRGLYNQHGRETIEKGSGRAGSPCLRIPAAQGLSTYTGFWGNPQVNLLPGRRYRFSAWVKTQGALRQAYLSGDTYEWSPHDATRLERHRSAVIGSETAAAERPATDDEGWTRLELHLRTPAYDVNIDPRIIVHGEAGSALLVDDVELVEEAGP